MKVNWRRWWQGLPRVAPARRAFRLALEELETRLVPSGTPLVIAALGDSGQVQLETPNPGQPSDSVEHNNAQGNLYTASSTAAAGLMNSWSPAALLMVGDEDYNFGSSALIDLNIGKLYNQYISPYPSPNYLNPSGPYLNHQDNLGHKDVTFTSGGSPFGFNQLWPAAGDHEYGASTEGVNGGNVVGPNPAPATRSR